MYKIDNTVEFATVAGKLSTWRGRNFSITKIENAVFVERTDTCTEQKGTANVVNWNAKFTVRGVP